MLHPSAVSHRRPLSFQRLSAFVLLFAAIAIVLGSGWLLVRLSLGDSVERAADARRLVEGYERALGGQGMTGRRLQDLRQDFGAWPVLLDGTTAAGAVASLEQQASAVIASAGGQLQSWEAGQPTKDNGFLQTAIHFDLALPGTRLPTLLSSLETHRPYLFIDRLEISTLAAGEPAAGETPGGGDRPAPGQLSVRLDLHGYARLP